MSEGAFRTCPLCGTRNRHYMMVCTKCGRSLEAVALVGTPPPGFVVVRRSRVGRLVLGLLTLAAAAAAALLLSRLLRSTALEPEASASTAAVGDEAPPRTGTDRSPSWKTLEQRFAEVGPPPISQPTPPPISQPTPPPTTVAPALATPAPATLLPATPVPATPPPAPPEPPRRRTASAAGAAVALAERATAPPADEDEDPDPARLRAARRDALERAEEHLRALERRTEELRRQMGDQDSAAPDKRDALRMELRKVQRQLEQADRQVIRAEWALRAAEQ